MKPESLEYFKEKLQDFQQLSPRELLFLINDYIALKATIDSQATTIASLQSQITALDARVTDLETP